MKKLSISLFFFLLLIQSLTLLAQSPMKFSYQAVVRDQAGHLVQNRPVSTRISILQGTISGTVVFMEEHHTITNVNGLLTLEVGGGVTMQGDFSKIDWANGPYFLKTEYDLTGGNNYQLSGTSQLLSVPYAIHAISAEKLTNPVNETDPEFKGSVAGGISQQDTARWNSKADTIAETDPVYSHSLAGALQQSDTAYWNSKLDSFTETDPHFNSSVAAALITADTARWNAKLDSFTEADPVFDTSVAASITKADTTRWNQIQNLSNANSFYLGQDTMGGIVFYLYTGSDGKQHGLIAAKWDTAGKWQVTTPGTVGANRSWDGVYNTGKMSTGNYIKTNVQALGTGWYVPSIDEMVIMYHNRHLLNKALYEGGYGPIKDIMMWSSTEAAAPDHLSHAYIFSFYTGTIGIRQKENYEKVRAIKAF